MSRLHRWLGSLVALVALAFVAVTLQKNLAAVPPVVVSGRLVVVGAAGVLATTAATALAALAWRTLLAGAGSSISAARAFAICGTAQLGKYLPGNIFHLVGRATLASREGVPLPVTLASMTLETLLVIATGALLALPLLVEHRAALSMLFTPRTAWMWIGAVVVVVVAGIFVWRRFRARVQETLGAAWRIATLRTVVVVVVCDVLTFLLLGGSLYLVAATAWPALALSPSACVFGFALAWVIGFVTPGAPGGVGVREAVFLILLGSSAGPAVASSLAITSRVLSMVGDLVTFAIATLVEQRTRGLRPPGDRA